MEGPILPLLLAVAEAPQQCMQRRRSRGEAARCRVWRSIGRSRDLTNGVGASRRCWVDERLTILTNKIVRPELEVPGGDRTISETFFRREARS